MSFKRDGDDTNLLKSLNHQRVKELLSNHIPEDEAKLLSNGRLTCTMCLHRPIFDTINMLAIHRRGKRHMLELSKYIKCKEDASVKALQSASSLYTSSTIDESSQLKIKNSPRHSFTSLGSGHKEVKQITMKYKRKPTLEIQPSLPTKIQMKSRVKSEGQSATATVRQYLKSMSRKSSLEKVVEKSRDNYGLGLSTGSNLTKPSGPYTLVPTTSEPSFTSEQATPQKPSSSNSVSSDHELKLKMSGWIKDWSGGWTKDPNVEFDSDEDDTPPSPLPR